jgi:hypothetical protein
LQPPGPLPGSTVPVEAVRIIDMQGNNAWGSAADAWLQHRCAARACETAAKSLRALVEADVREAYGHGVRIARDRAGRLLLKEDAA